MAATLARDCEGFHRRDLLRFGAGFFGLQLADLLRLQARGGTTRQATSVILVWLAGGPATIDLWDLKPDAPDNIRGEFKPISTSVPGVRLCEHLPKLARLMHKCALVRSVHHGIPEHGLGTAYVTTGNRPGPALEYPSLGALASRLLPAPPGVPAHVSFARLGGPGYLGAAYTPFEVEGRPEQGRVRVPGIALPDGFSPADLENRSRLRATFDAAFRALDRADLPGSLDRFQQQALDILRSDQTRRAFDLTREPESLRDAYGRDAFGQGALVARRLVEAGVRFVTVSLSGWDTHAGHFPALRFRLPQLDRTLAMLVEDLDRRGLLETTIVYCAGEFGRTPHVNAAAGRDHWARAMSVWLAGGGLRQGTVIGSTDRQGLAPVDDPCAPDDVAATLFHALGVPPWHEVTTTTGRPVAIFREGKVLEKLLG